MVRAAEREATSDLRFPELRRPGFLTTWVPRAGTLAAMAAGYVVLTLLADEILLLDLQRVFIFAIAAVSINLLIGYAGQISLGHQAFFGVGALASAGLVSSVGWSFWPAILAAALLGATAAALLGVVALRLRGLYLALITLAFGFFAENVLFNIRSLTRGAAGMPAPRPEGFGGQLPYLYLCMAFFVLVQLLDWRLVSSKAGRAILAVRDDERVAASVGVNVTMYKVIAFALSGSFAGLAGALFAHQTGLVLASDFNFELALTFVFIAVVGGLGSRVGVFVAAAFFTLFESFAQSLREYVPLIGAILLVLTLILNPGGLAQALRPLVDWFQGKPFRLPHRH
ncbi:MAG TPA: branched-chain amino acid ABC transporter permease [Actinomycetota bacterium]|jgi:branched-chain amino acid transport system permease protein|nr:branched-chain amino acid ABC transporter permease [Actinomycetota bacterium]